MAKSLQERTKKGPEIKVSDPFFRSNDLYRLVVEDIPHTQLDLVYIVQGF